METKDEAKRVAIHFYNVKNEYGEKKTKAEKIIKTLKGFKWEMKVNDAYSVENKKKGFKYVGHDKFEEYTESEYSTVAGIIDAQKKVER